jgi:hypothetical protein
MTKWETLVEGDLTILSYLDILLIMRRKRRRVTKKPPAAYDVIECESIEIHNICQMVDSARLCFM